MCFHPGIACCFAASLLLTHRVMSKMSFLMKARRKGQCQCVMCRDCDRERGHRYKFNVTNNTWGSIMGRLQRERQHLRDPGQVEFSPPLGVNDISWPSISWCFTFFDILDHFKHLTLKWQGCCSCSCMVLPNKLRLRCVSLESQALPESCRDAVFNATGTSPAEAQTGEDRYWLWCYKF